MWVRRFEDRARIAANVERARDAFTGRDVVLKERVQREVDVSLSVAHPAFRPLCGHVADEGWMAFAHVEGEHLPERPNRDLVVQLLRGLMHLHAAGFAHGDLKRENLLVADGRLRIIDLAFAGPLGAPPLGGTPGLLAPEVAAGSPLSVASDLFALGRLLEDARDREVRDLARACLADDPQARPASAGSCLAQLGAHVRPWDRRRLPQPEAEALLAAMPREGTSVVVPGAAGDLTPVLLAEYWRRGEAVADLDLRADPWAAFLGPGEGPLIGRVAATRDVLIVLRSCDTADEDARDAIVALATALQVRQSGGLLALDADDELTDRLRAAGASAIPIDAWTPAQIRDAARDYGVREDASLLRDIADCSGGNPALVRHVLAALADDPTRPPADILAAQDSAMAPARGLAAARAALAVGAGRRALAALLDEPAPASLRADAHALVGELEKAVEIEDEPESAARRIQRAERLLRLGRWKEAKREAIRAVREDSSLRDQARVIEATVLRERGDLEAASAILTTPAAYPWSVRLALLQSDLAASHGNTEEAEQLAERALSLSEDDALRAQAHARIAAAFAARGEWRPARTRYALARELFERTDDFSGWPAYVMNVATADHALGDFGRAIEGYGAAERLAERFRRPITAAAAATNLASLLLAVGAHDEARVVLERAKAQSAAINYAMYGALCLLIEAELVGREHPEEGTHLALRARDDFRSLGASKQAWEATLVAASFGDASPLDPEAIEAVGLSARLWLVDGRRALNDGQPALAADLAARALKRCESDDDRLRVLEALELCAASSPRADEASRFKDRAAALRKAIAETLPAGLRLRFDRPKQPPPAVGGGDARRVLALARRVLMERDEQRLYAFALDEAVAMTGAERAFLLKRIPKKRPQVVVARNIDREHIRRSRFRFSRSVAEKVLSSGEPFLTARAAQDPALESAQSVHAMGLRSILCVPIRSPDAVVAALYLDHRFSEARFGSEERELLAALADLLGLAIENARLHAASQRRNEELSLTAQRAQQESAHRAAEIRRLASELAKAEAGEDSRVLVRSGPMRRVIDLVERAAPTDLTVLIEGESGTGKEVFAREIHARSGRSEGTFVGINCGALSETLLESELFGHVRGAFTDAIRDSPGLFRSARGGTLLLDEVGEMPPRMQTRLLRVLQERVVRPVGGGAEVPVDVRVIAATNRDLNAEVEAGRFRQDLYFRLAAVQLTLPPLRERREEIPALVTTLLARIAREPGMRQLSASRDALRELMLHDWPGNIRELEQALRRAVLMADGERLDASHLDLGQTIQPRRVALQRHDAKLVEDALRACDGNKSRTARALGISRPTLYRWMQRYGLH